MALERKDVEQKYKWDLTAIYATEADFFEDYKKLENKSVVVEKIFDKETAIKILQEAFVAYEEKFVKYSNFSHYCANK